MGTRGRGSHITGRGRALLPALGGLPSYCLGAVTQEGRAELAGGGRHPASLSAQVSPVDSRLPRPLAFSTTRRPDTGVKASPEHR